MESCYHELGRPKITGVLGGPSSGGINRGPRIESLKKTALFSHFSSCQTDGVLLPPRGTSGVVRDSVLKSGTPGRFVLVVQSGRGGARPDPPASFCWRRPLEHTKYPRTLVLCTPAPPPPTGHTPLNLDQTGRLHTYVLRFLRAFLRRVISDGTDPPELQPTCEPHLHANRRVFERRANFVCTLTASFLSRLRGGKYGIYLSSKRWIE